MDLRKGLGALRLFKLAGTVGMLALATGILSNTSCYVESCDDDDDDSSDDDDDDCWDDDGDDDDDDDGSGSSLGEEGPVDWTLREYKLIPAQEPGAHPVRSIIEVRGFSLRSKLGPAVYGDAEIQHFAAQVLHANEKLIGLPDGPGRLRFDAIDHQPDFILITYVQELIDERDVATLIPGAAITLVLDLQGRLIEIDSSLRTDGKPAPDAINPIHAPGATAPATPTTPPASTGTPATESATQPEVEPVGGR